MNIGGWEIDEVHVAECVAAMGKMPDGCVDFVLTDPPYTVGYQSKHRKILHEKIVNDDNTDWLEPAFAEIYRVLKPDSLCFTFYGWSKSARFFRAFRRVGFVLKSHFVFIKSKQGFGWFARSQHEVGVLLAKGDPPKPSFAISNVVPFLVTQNKFHPTQKDVGAVSHILTAYTEVGDLVVDPFAGSGTTAVSAKKHGRRYLCFEIDEKNVNVACERLKQCEPFGAAA